jgi:signal transduction histidine kinase/ActR/RegA family two-component response regulator
MYDHVASTGRSIRAERHAGPLQRWYSFSLFRPNEARPRQVAAVFRDITAHKRAEEQLRRNHQTFFNLIQNAPLGIYVVDAQFRLRQVSAGAQKVFSNVRPLLGRDFEEVLRIIWPEPFASEAIGRFRHTLETGERYAAPATTERRNDIDEVEAYDWQIERIVMPDGQHGVVCYFYDLSERRKAEMQLERADRAKSAFLAMLSHELRNPLAPLRNAVALMERRAGDERLGREALGIMKRQLEHLSRLVDDLLEVSRIEHGKIELRMGTMVLADALRAAIEIVQPMIDERHQRLGAGLPGASVLVRGDAARITQVMANLLHNASKFTPPGGAIALSVHERADRVDIEVRDEGKGITPEELPHIFELFDQGELHSQDRSLGGLGIGLSLARGLVEMHGGSIEAASRGRGRGSEFVVRLPTAASASAPAPAPPQARDSATLAGRRILVVDDNHDSADSLAALLQLGGNDVQAAYGGAEAFAKAHAIRPEAILLDIGMPNISGYDVCRKIRAEPWGRGIAIVALTGWGQAHDREKSREAGFDGHLVKPVDHAALTDLLASVVARRARSHSHAT